METMLAFLLFSCYFWQLSIVESFSFYTNSHSASLNIDTRKRNDYIIQTNIRLSSTSSDNTEFGRLEELKQQEASLARMLAELRMEKLSVIRSRPLTIGIVGFGRFGQFIAKTFTNYGSVIATSRSDYTDLANNMGITYIPLSDTEAFLNEDLDVIVLASSIVSFESTVANLVPYLERQIEKSGTGRGPLVVDVLSVKEHPRQIMLDLLPKECDILCTHPMFGPDSGKNGWHGLTFVYEQTRIDGVILDQSQNSDCRISDNSSIKDYQGHTESFVEKDNFKIHSIHENSEAHIEGMDRIERFLSIWEEEGCRMVPLSCSDHDSYAANSQFIAHLMGRILGAQGLEPTPIDTKGFDSVMKLIDTTTADSFELFYGLYKYNPYSIETILKLKDSMDDVVEQLKEKEDKDRHNIPKWLTNDQRSFNSSLRDIEWS